MRNLEDPDSPTIPLDPSQRLLQSRLAVSFLPLLDRRPVREIVPSLVDFDTVRVEMVMELCV
jgi:hypothetical protein